VADPGDVDWVADDWESARRRSFVRGLRVSPTERVAWLEEMIQVAWASGALPHPRSALGERLDRATGAPRKAPGKT
jgi:hypothetical protein